MPENLHDLKTRYKNVEWGPGEHHYKVNCYIKLKPIHVNGLIRAFSRPVVEDVIIDELNLPPEIVEDIEIFDIEKVN